MTTKKEIKIVIIDDNKDAGEAWAKRLEKDQIIAAPFTNGQEALDFLAKKTIKITAVLLDYVLDPIMSGEEVLQALKNQFPQIPVIVFSGKTHSSSVNTLVKGAYANLRRPLNPNELIRILHEIADFEDTFMTMAKDVSQLLKSDVSLVWKRDKRRNEFKIIGWSGEVDKEYLQNTILDTSDRQWLTARHGQPFFIPALKEANNFQYLEKIIERDWTSLICIPLIHEGKLVGMVDNFFIKEKKFRKKRKWENTQKMLSIFAAQVVETFHATELTKHLRVLQEINQSLASTLEEEAILELVLYKAVEVVGAHYGWLYMRDEVSNRFKLKKYQNIAPHLLDQYKKIGEGITGWVAQKGIEKYIPDMTRLNEEEQGEPIFKPTKGLVVKSEIAIPLKREDNILGVLTIKSSFKNFFTVDEIELLLSLADIAAVAVERSKLTKHLQELSALAQRADNFHQLADYVVKAAKDITGTAVSLWMLSTQEGEGDDWMRIVAQQAEFSEQYIEEIKLPNDPEQSINAAALGSGEVIIRSDLLSEKLEPSLYRLEDAKSFKWHSFMAVPLIGRQGEKIGVLSFYSQDIGKFKAKDGELMKAFANHAAVAFQELRRIIAMSQLAQVGYELSVRVEDTRTLLKKVAGTAQLLTGANCVCIYPYDPVRQKFYQKEAIVMVGTRTRRTQIADKPRGKGLAALVREHQAIVVDSVEKGQIRIGLENPKKSSTKEILDRINEAKFIKRENIKAFIGISLRTSEKEGKNKALSPHEVGVFYLNFRAPHFFSEEELQVIKIFAHQVANIIYQHQLLEKTEKQKRELETLHDLSIGITSQTELNKRLDKIIESSIKLLNAKGGKLYLIEEGKKKLKLVRNKGIKKGIEIDEFLKFGEGLAGKVIAKQQPMIENDYANWDGAVENYRNYFSSVIAVPLVLNDKPIGVLSVFDDNQKRIFYPDDIEILERLAQQAALSIYNAKINKEKQDLYDIASQATPRKSADEVLRKIRSVVEYEKATFQMIDTPDNHRELLAFEGIEEDEMTEELLRPIEKDSLITKVFKHHDILVIPDTNKEDLWNSNLPQTKDINSWIGIPLVDKGKKLGLLTLDHRQVNFYNDSHKAKLKEFIDKALVIINIAIKNKHFEEIENIRKDEKIIKKESDNLTIHYMDKINNLITYYSKIDDVEKINKYLAIKEKILFEHNSKQPFLIKQFFLKDISIFDIINWHLQPRVNILLGKNGLGKSHLLRLIACLLQKSREEINESYDPLSSIIKLVIEQKRQFKHIEYKHEKFGEQNPGKFPLLAIPAVRSISKSEPISHHPLRIQGELHEVGATYLIQQKSYAPFLQNRLFVFGNDLLKKKGRRRKIKKVIAESALVKLINHVVKELADYDFTIVDIEEKEGFAEIEIKVLTESNEQPIALQKASQGTLSVLYIFMLIYHFLRSLYPKIKEEEILNQSAVVIIDEVDAHLHPDWQQKIVYLLRNSFPNIQFILSAHSPLVVSGCLENEVAMLTHNRNKTTRNFTLHQFKEHFIGAKVEDIYRKVFEMEHVNEDPTYAELLTDISLTTEEKIEEEKFELQEKEELNSVEQNKLEQLTRMLQVIEIQKRKESEDLESKIAELKAQLRAARE